MDYTPVMKQRGDQTRIKHYIDSMNQLRALHSEMSDKGYAFITSELTKLLLSMPPQENTFLIDVSWNGCGQKTCSFHISSYRRPNSQAATIHVMFRVNTPDDILLPEITEIILQGNIPVYSACQDDPYWKPYILVIVNLLTAPEIQQRVVAVFTHAEQAAHIINTAKTRLHNEFIAGASAEALQVIVEGVRQELADSPLAIDIEHV